MDHEINRRCEQWARELFGGAYARLDYPSATLQQRTSKGLQTMSDDAYAIEQIVVHLENPWRRLIKVHYLHPGNTIERMARMRCSRWAYYRLLDEAHVMIREQLVEQGDARATFIETSIRD